ncbi:hypothetical protein [Marinoscillum furvescens]|uniref:Uncharacterized protein n=1 Tax=Marinoscillum furvescens DSM 4134 TaxID=1122208 RepID=A0A3D9L2Y6_MARFU|nr:hypothetical protein [Marinoscillum furvescens]RED99393.1 hypothetical protein C7460_1088 [Marinoscillum furvescens DSM 4134]
MIQLIVNKATDVTIQKAENPPEAGLSYSPMLSSEAWNANTHLAGLLAFP